MNKEEAIELAIAYMNQSSYPFHSTTSVERSSKHDREFMRERISGEKGKGELWEVIFSWAIPDPNVVDSVTGITVVVDAETKECGFFEHL